MDENNFNNPGNDNQNGYGSQQPYQQNDYNNQSFSQPVDFTQPQYGYTPPMAEPEMSVKDWLITFLILMIPCVGFVMVFVWAFSNENKTRSNYFKAYLIVVAISIVLGFIFSAILGSMMYSIFSSLMYM